MAIDAALASDNPLGFIKNLLERIQKPILTIDDKLEIKNIQYNINREAAKASAEWSGKIDKYEYITGEEVLPSNRSQVIEQALKKQTETQIDALKSLSINKTDELKQIESNFRNTCSLIWFRKKH